MSSTCFQHCANNVYYFRPSSCSCLCLLSTISSRCQVFTLLLQFASFGYSPPTYGRVQTRPYLSKGGGSGSALDYVLPPCTAFSERCLSLVVRLYQTTASWHAKSGVLENIVQVCLVSRETFPFLNEIFCSSLAGR